MHNTVSTVHYLKAGAKHILSKNMVPPLPVGFPNDQTMQSSNTYLLNFPALYDEAYEGHILPSVAQSSLLSIVKL